MPIHDWTRVDAGLYHHFHQEWTMQFCNALNAGGWPAGCVAVADQQAGGPIPDVLPLPRRPKGTAKSALSAGRAVAEAPPRARFVIEGEEDTYARRANRI